MANQNFKGLLIVAAGAALMVAANGMAQTAQRRPASTDVSNLVNRSSTLEQLGLDDQAAGLSSGQKGEIDQIVDTYLAEQKALRAKYPVTPGTPPSPEAEKAYRAAQTRMSAGLARVLTDEQKKAIQASQEAKLAQRLPAGDRRLER